MVKVVGYNEDSTAESTSGVSNPDSVTNEADMVPACTISLDPADRKASSSSGDCSQQVNPGSSDLHSVAWGVSSVRTRSLIPAH